MSFIADLHIHSHLSRACSPELRPEPLHRWCQLKGIDVLASGDFTHPRWMAELEEKLVPAEAGLFRLEPALAAKVDEQIPAACRAPVRFVLGVEVSSIYKKNGRVRKVHNLLFAPSFDVAKEINARLGKIGNLKSDGRPILGLDAKELLKIVRGASDRAYLIPAHAWTPHFAVFGSESGFDSLEECFEELTSEIFAVETGLSSDPPMNRRISALDRLTLISNSDAHSPEKLAREANEVDGELSYDGLFAAVRRRKVRTLEFFPEEGKYHADGHRACGARLEPAETLRRKGLCPACGKPVTVGVLHRVEKLADRAAPVEEKNFEYLIPLKELLGQVLRVGSSSRRVDRWYHELLAEHGSELGILRHLDPAEIAGGPAAPGAPLLRLALERMRRGEVSVQAGYDGEYGVISAIKEGDFAAAEGSGQLSLL